MNTTILSKMKNEEFLELGNSSLAFVKKENHENDRLESDVFSVYFAHGTLLAAFESEESAIAAIIQSGLEYTNLH